MIKFTDDHEWLKIEGDTAVVGITDYAQEQLGDLVFVELPAIGATFTKGAVAAVVESVKAASEIYAPVDGEVVAFNEAVTGDPALVNSSAMNEGWLFKVKLKDMGQVAGLKSEDEYKTLIGAAS